MSDFKLPYGIRNNELVSVKDVERGLKCNAVCPCCGSQLIARKGNKMAPHFAHYNSEECSGGLETALHLKAKAILEETNHFLLPPLITNIGIGYESSVELLPERLIEFDSIRLEKKREDIIPDIIIEKDGEELLLEISVTHFIDKEKLEKIKMLNISTIEIDLSKEESYDSDDLLYEKMLEDVKSKKWVYSKKTERFQKELLPYRKEFKVVHRGLAGHVDNCPLRMRTWRGKVYANLVDDCFLCRYMMDKRGFGLTSHTHIMCGGMYTSEIESIVKKCSQTIEC